eukprot:TRINITY_DN900_c0_g1_i1.p1 TRINITY_DN900_c0_g1~~TRINITY_DN900_c0_g1_i1.p1  ORF type:complete len:189 (+),score=10.69 TRINITY_DN900_c0_g1_i1:109-675(+)
MTFAPGRFVALLLPFILVLAGATTFGYGFFQTAKELDHLYGTSTRFKPWYASIAPVFLSVLSGLFAVLSVRSDWRTVHNLANSFSIISIATLFNIATSYDVNIGFFSSCINYGTPDYVYEENACTNIYIQFAGLAACIFAQIWILITLSVIDGRRQEVREAQDGVSYHLLPVDLTPDEIRRSKNRSVF